MALFTNVGSYSESLDVSDDKNEDGMSSSYNFSIKSYSFTATNKSSEILFSLKNELLILLFIYNYSINVSFSSY